PDEMEGVVVSRQICLAALAARRRPVLETFAERLQSASAAFHNQQARNGVRTHSVLTPLLGFNGLVFFNCFNHCWSRSIIGNPQKAILSNRLHHETYFSKKICPEQSLMIVWTQG